MSLVNIRMKPEQLVRFIRTVSLVAPLILILAPIGILGIRIHLQIAEANHLGHQLAKDLESLTAQNPSRNLQHSLETVFNQSEPLVELHPFIQVKDRKGIIVAEIGHHHTAPKQSIHLTLKTENTGTLTIELTHSFSILFKNFALPIAMGMGIGLMIFSVARILVLPMIRRTIDHLVSTQEQLVLERQRADEANHAKSFFLANISHEIRTPLSAIIGFSDLGLHARNPGEHLDYLKKIHSSGNTLLEIINAVLDFSKIEAGKVELEKIPFRLDALVALINSIVESLGKEKALTFNCRIAENFPEWVLGDPLRLKQILTNLAGNAVKFTEKGSITFEGRIIEQTDDHYLIEFRIRDTGIGLKPEQLESIFSPFHQSDNSTTRKYGGTGLGLAITRDLTTLMGGEIFVESEYGHGASFTLRIPFEMVPDEMLVEIQKNTASTYFQKATDHLKGARILLVEDNDVNQEIGRHILKRVGAEVDIAGNGSIALEMVRKSPDCYQAILMDLQMPVMDGFEATRAIRDLKLERHIPIIAMTAHALSEERQKCLQAGMDDHLTKPINPGLLYQTLSHLIRPLKPPPADHLITRQGGA